MIGDELAATPGIGAFEKFYIRLLGVPICGLRIRLRRILPYLGSGYATILDAGCGRGVFSYQLARKFPNAKVTGIDLDEDRLVVNREIASRTGLNNLEFSVCDVTKIPEQAYYDMVLSVDNLEHVENDEAAIMSIKNALKPGGKLVLHVPGYERRWLFFKFQTNFDVPGHFRPGYTLEGIRAKISAAGFDVDDAFYTYGWFETVANNLSYVITQAEAKNKLLYAMAFPFLNLMSWLGRNSKPAKGAGVMLLATKKVNEE